MYLSCLQMIKMTMEEGKDSLDNFVFCVANRKVINKLHKEVQDLVSVDIIALSS